MSLNVRQTRFVQSFALHQNGSKAAREAGYSAKTASQMSFENLRKPEIQEALSALRREIEAKLGVSKDRAIREIQGAVEVAKAQGDASAMIAGWREIARMCGYYDKERAAKVSINVTAKRVIEKMETMTDAELMEVITDNTDS